MFYFLKVAPRIKLGLYKTWILPCYMGGKEPGSAERC